MLEHFRVRHAMEASVIILLICKLAGFTQISFLTAVSPLLIFWGLWLAGAVVYFPYWYLKRRNKNRGS